MWRPATCRFLVFDVGLPDDAQVGVCRVLVFDVAATHRRGACGRTVGPAWSASDFQKRLWHSGHVFTGIIAAVGTVTAIEQDTARGLTRLEIGAPGIVDDLEAGGSLAVDGVCLTRVATTTSPAGVFRTELMGETTAVTTLGALSVGDPVNLERCVPAGGRLDGHVVQGHVDGTGTVLIVDPQGGWQRIRIGIPSALAGQVARKGAIAVNGVSLTITEVNAPTEAEPWFEVGVIPATLEQTTLGRLAVGSRVNIETDVFAKYTERLLQVRDAQS